MDLKELDSVLGDLDSILDEAKSYNAKHPPSAKDGTWSLDDIDRLIADTSTSGFVADTKAKAAAEQEAPPAPVRVRRFPNEDVPVSTYFKRPESQKAEKPAPAPKQPDVSGIFPELDVDKILEETLGRPAAPAKPKAAPVEPKTAPAEPKNAPAEPKTAPAEPKTAPAEPKTAPAEPKTAPAEPKTIVMDAKAVPEEPKTVIIKSKPAPAEKQEEEVKPYVPGKAPAPPAEEHIPDFDPLTRYEESKKREAAAMRADKNRENFIHPPRPTLPVEVEEEPFGPIDKPGILVEKPASQLTSDLEPLPKIISADKAKIEAEAGRKTLVRPLKGKHTPERESAAEDADEAEEDPNQIRMVELLGDSLEEKPREVNEDVFEQKVVDKRRDAADEFVLVPDADNVDLFPEPEEVSVSLDVEPEKPKKSKKAPQPSEMPRPFPIREYRKTDDKRKVNISLQHSVNGYTRQAIVSAVFCGALLLTALIPAIFEKAGITSAWFGRGAPGIFVLNAVLLIAAITANNNIFADGLACLRAGKPNGNTAVALSALVAFLQNTVVAVAKSNSVSSLPVFTLAAVIGFITADVAGAINCRRMLHNFVLCAYKYDDGVFAVHPFEDEAEVRELGRVLLMDKADLLYSSKTKFPADFVKNSDNNNAEQKSAKTLLPLSAAAAVLVGGLSAFICRDWLQALTAAAAAFCLCSPVCAALAPALSAGRMNRFLNEEGSMVSGADAAEEISGANAVVIDSAELFNRSRCKMHGMVDYKTVRLDDVLVYAAALVIKSGGPLRDCFENVISSDHGLLPTVRDLVYEDKLGISARILGQKVLLGNRSLLLTHGIDVPEDGQEKKQLRAGKNVIYLAVAGNPAAMFVVSYKLDTGLKPYFEELEAAGTQILVRTNDVNVTEDMLSQGFDMPPSAFRVLGSVAGRLYTNRREEVKEKLSVKAVHNGSAVSMLRLVTAAQRLTKDMDALFVLQVILSVVGIAGAAVLVGLNLPAWLNGITVALYLLVRAGVHELAAIVCNGKE